MRQTAQHQIGVPACSINLSLNMKLIIELFFATLQANVDILRPDTSWRERQESVHAKPYVVVKSKMLLCSDCWSTFCFDAVIVGQRSALMPM